MGKRFSGRRPEDQPIYVNPANMDFEKRQLLSGISIPTSGGSSGSPASAAIKTGRCTTYMVAASDAPAHIRAQADYVCDGIELFDEESLEELRNKGWLTDLFVLSRKAMVNIQNAVVPALQLQNAKIRIKEGDRVKFYPQYRSSDV